MQAVVLARFVQQAPCLLWLERLLNVSLAPLVLTKIILGKLNVCCAKPDRTPARLVRQGVTLAHEEGQRVGVRAATAAILATWVKLQTSKVRRVAIPVPGVDTTTRWEPRSASSVVVE